MNKKIISAIFASLISLNLISPSVAKADGMGVLNTQTIIQKSSLYSARIEGNPLELADVQVSDKKSQKKLEVFNITEATRFI
ncbi:MAG: hypothetical protein AABZ74_01080, partial [Cyanobacteriota bacterium]